MSEALLPTRPAGDGLDVDPASGTGDRRRKAVVFGALALAGLAGAGLLLLGGGSDELDEAATTPVPPVTDVVATPQSTAPPLQAVDDARPARDPFTALYVPPAPVATTGVGTTDGAGGPGPTTPSAPPLGEPAAVPVGGPAAGTEAAPAAGTGAGPAPASRRLLLDGVRGSGDSRTAVFVVGDERVTVGVGDAFGPEGELLLLSLQQGPTDGQWTAVVQVGKGEPFDVVTGSPVTLG